MLRNACDIHTHTIYSRHAYSTIEENVRAAAELRLELLGCTEHFSSMLHPPVATEDGRLACDTRDYQYFYNFGCWPRVWHGVRLLHGCEADIVDLEGNLFGHDVVVDEGITGDAESPATLKDRVFSRCDYVIASVHGRDFARGADLSATTKMYLSALQDPKVLVLGHPVRGRVPFEHREVVRAARDLHKLIEINAHSLDAAIGRKDTIDGCQALAELCAEEGCKIVVSSDAHISCGVGGFDLALRMLERIHFPQALIATRDAESFLRAMREGVGTTIE